MLAYTHPRMHGSPRIHIRTHACARATVYAHAYAHANPLQVSQSTDLVFNATVANLNELKDEVSFRE